MELRTTYFNFLYVYIIIIKKYLSFNLILSWAHLKRALCWTVSSQFKRLFYTFKHIHLTSENVFVFALLTQISIAICNEFTGCVASYTATVNTTTVTAAVDAADAICISHIKCSTVENSCFTHFKDVSRRQAAIQLTFQHIIKFCIIFLSHTIRKCKLQVTNRFQLSSFNTKPKHLSLFFIWCVSLHPRHTHSNLLFF